MELLHALAFGIFVLILMYLGLSNSGGVAAIFNSGGPQLNTTIKTLQGR